MLAVFSLLLMEYCSNWITLEILAYLYNDFILYYWNLHNSYEQTTSSSFIRQECQYKTQHPFHAVWVHLFCIQHMHIPTLVYVNLYWCMAWYTSDQRLHCHTMQMHINYSCTSGSPSLLMIEVSTHFFKKRIFTELWQIICSRLKSILLWFVLSFWDKDSFLSLNFLLLLLRQNSAL